ncbi:MAG: hypothetical protein AAF772_15400 [Acidobacteriota bacterium]
MLLILLLALGGAVLAASPGFGADDPFYLQRLQVGRDALARGDAAIAARDLRIASFGLLDELMPLVESLVFLALAEDALGDADDVRAAAMRVDEVRTRFPDDAGRAWRALIPADRARFETALARHLSDDALTAWPMTTEAGAAARVARLDPSTADAPSADDAQTGAGAAEDAQTEAGADDVAEAPSAAAPAPTATEAPTATDDVALAIDDIRRQLAAPGLTTARLQQLYARAGGLADAHPDRDAAQWTAGELAYRQRLWADTVAYFTRSTPPAGEPNLCFYYAVALYETGEARRARRALRRCGGGLARSPFVDDYLRKIGAR